MEHIAEEIAHLGEQGVSKIYYRRTIHKQLTLWKTAIWDAENMHEALHEASEIGHKGLYTMK